MYVRVKEEKYICCFYLVSVGDFFVQLTLLFFSFFFSFVLNFHFLLYAFLLGFDLEYF